MEDALAERYANMKYSVDYQFIERRKRELANEEAGPKCFRTEHEQNFKK